MEEKYPTHLVQITYPGYSLAFCSCFLLILSLLLFHSIPSIPFLSLFFSFVSLSYQFITSHFDSLSFFSFLFFSFFSFAILTFPLSSSTHPSQSPNQITNHPRDQKNRAETQNIISTETKGTDENSRQHHAQLGKIHLNLLDKLDSDSDNDTKLHKIFTIIRELLEQSLLELAKSNKESKDINKANMKKEKNKDAAATEIAPVKNTTGEPIDSASLERMKNFYKDKEEEAEWKKKVNE